MEQTICNICGKVKEGGEKESIDGRLRFCTNSRSKDGNTLMLSCETKEIYLCPTCSRGLMRCANAMKEHKRIKIGRKNEE